MTYDLGRAPREGCAAEIEPEQQHDSKTNDGKTAEPIDGSYAIIKACLWIMNVQEQQ